MFSIQKSKTHKGKCTPNALPCRVHHNGPVNTPKRYWDPRTSPDGKTVSYFRGRKLHGKKLKVPKGFRGVVLSSTDRILPKPQSSDAAEDEDVEEIPEVKIIEEQSEFEEMVVWGHEALPDEMADPYLRGMEEWIAFAETIHSNDDDANDEPSKLDQ
ncbi:ribonuclease H2 non-catalytic subunit-domain-containing protein [Amylocarpus encephaloides]|uniref:Ribonuclease H2 non-catalytic subunit-domain-containing protein n=1 Tax=Amylocarpus encephaloides TaxID=45428 RepID=A0A9P8C9I7_9HELO|nr:ribonuclease H2 non-catalytic subunit-domain-containing protein [Amylocarpus encephaloides]